MKLISSKQLCKIVEQKGWVLQRITGSHQIYENPARSRFESWNLESLDENSPAI